uniref:tRNA/rRNA methyltransferase SpoU type domain-containing protein n=1 Tax=Anopheles atroparvus TaxID=41427 RepID=A0AAG5CQI8_ANOAO
MFRTWKVIRYCAGKSDPTVVQLPRCFSVVNCAQQKLSTALLAPRGSRAGEQPQPAADSTTPDQLTVNRSAELAAEDELLDNRKNIPNLNLSELLKDVPRTKLVRRMGDDERVKKPPKPTHKKTAIEKDTLQILQHRYQDRSESEERYDKVLKLRYTILQSNDDRHRDLMALMGSRKCREREKRLVLEGRRLIVDGCAAGLQLEAIVTSDLKLLSDLQMKPRPRDCSYLLVTRQTMMEWSSLTTSPGLIGIFAEPPNLTEVIAKNAASSRRLPLTVVCDNIREPNNLGSVIRSCAAVSAQEIVLLKGCAHPWDLKCLRGGAGAHFRIPIHGPMELYQLPEHTRTGSMFVLADNKRTNDEREGFLWRHYDRIDYGSADHVVLVIGGETYGVSDDIRKLVHQLTKTNDGYVNDRKFVAHIPLANGVESLNTASALSIILYEMRRSLLPANEAS